MRVNIDRPSNIRREKDKSIRYYVHVSIYCRDCFWSQSCRFALHRMPGGGGSPGSFWKPHTTAGAEETKGNKTIRRWSWLCTQNPAPTRPHLNVWFGIYFHPQFPGTHWLHIRSCIWKGGLGEDGWEMQRERSGVGVWVWLGRCCSRSLKPPGRYFRYGASGCHKEPLPIWSKRQLYLFLTLNDVQALGTFHIFAVCLLQKRDACSSLTGTLLDPVVLRPTSTQLWLVRSHPL